jgi:uncharacterized protein with gpF-like domain
MPRYDLAAMARRANPGMRRRSIVLRDIAPPAVLATNLYRSVYKPVMDAWTASADRIADAYARTVAEMTTDAPADVKAEIDGAAEQVNRLLLLLTPELRDWAIRVERWQRGKWRGAVLSATGVDVETMIGAGDMRATLETTIGWNTDLVRNVSDQTRQRISSAVFDGLRNRTPARDVAKSISEATGLGRDRSIRIASDQLNKLTSSLADERRREAGITAWEWVHSRKAHPRANHVARNGNYYSDDPADVGHTINGQAMLAPPEDRPGQLPYCGCRSRSVIDLSD